MKPITPKQLGSIRADIQTGLLPSECNILSVTNTTDSQGGHTKTWATASYAIPCRLDVVSGREVDGAGALSPYTSWRLTLPYDTTITAAHRVEIGSNTYNVTSVTGDQSWKAAIRVELEKV